MSFSENGTFELWRSFMPRRKEIQQVINNDLFSVQVYPQGFFDHFDAESAFEKWAAVEVSKFNAFTEGMKTLILPAGLYAVFLYTGAPENASDTFKYILGSWMSGSGYSLDNRPHFEVLANKYKNGDPESEEEIWIPIKPKP